jgi:hypothetical protein
MLQASPIAEGNRDLFARALQKRNVAVRFDGMREVPPMPSFSMSRRHVLHSSGCGTPAREAPA